MQPTVSSHRRLSMTESLRSLVAGMSCDHRYDAVAA
jgi:hypothetical protein